MVPVDFTDLHDALALDKKIPRERQGAVFNEGDELELKGGRFVIHKIIKKGLVLHGLPKRLVN